jgi:hypothetical protein
MVLLTQQAGAAHTVEARNVRRLAAIRALSARQVGAVHTVEAASGARKLVVRRALSA